MQSPDVDDQSKLKRLLRYLNSTRALTLNLATNKDIIVIAAIDAAHGVHIDAKGHTGARITLGRGSILCKSCKQQIVSKSSTETELIGTSDFLSLVIQVRDFLLEQGYNIQPAIIQQDNKSTITMIEHGRPTSDRTRHIHVRFFFIKDRADSKEVRIVYCPTGDMVADILTKPLQGYLFVKHRAELMGTAT